MVEFNEKEKAIIRNLNPLDLTDQEYEIAKQFMKSLVWAEIADLQSIVKDLRLGGLWRGEFAVMLKLYVWRQDSREE